MVYRICPVIGRDCACNDAEAAPCLGKLVADYLDELRDQVHGAPNDGFTLSSRRPDIAQLCESFTTDPRPLGTTHRAEVALTRGRTIAMGEVHYVMRRGRRIEVETVDAGIPPEKRRTTEPFVKVPLGWGEAAAKAIRSPDTLVLVELLYASWRARSPTFPLSNSRLKQLGVSRKIKSRVLRDLKRGGLITVKVRHGKTPTITLIAL
jgi:hypothetical protein